METLPQKSSPAFSTGIGGLPKVRLASPDGAQAEIYLFGAHVTSWIPSGGDERLYLSPNSVFKPGAAIRGGVPVIFPQFGGLGPLPKHGFARTQAWELASISGDAGSTAAEFHLADNENTRSIWPYEFLAKLKVSVGGKKLELYLTVTNTSDQPFSFTAALHTYLHVESIQSTFIEGLQGQRYFDTVSRPTRADWIEKSQDEPRIIFQGEVDRIYLDVPGPLRVGDAIQITTVTETGFPDAVVWNPGQVKAARLVDLGADNYQRMVCVEAAVVKNPILLGPSESWQGAQGLAA
jgi:glucose-6-phosphate 1-epimerase